MSYLSMLLGIQNSSSLSNGSLFRNSTRSFERRRNSAGVTGPGELIRIPSGDGMALVFFRTPEEPVHCAMEIASAIKTRPHIRLRMGIHSGPIDPVKDVNDRINIPELQLTSHND